MATLLVIEDEPALAKNMARYFQQLNHTVEIAHDGPSGIQAAQRLMPDVAIVDYQLPGLDGLEVIRALRRNDEQVRAVMVSGHASVSIAVDAMKAGSFDLLTKPVSLNNLRAVVDRALAETGSLRVLDYYQRREADASGLDLLAGESVPMRALRELVRAIASHEPADHSPVPPILILGETGSGKELVARACHFASLRGAGAFVEINCAALPPQLLEGELFGYEKGAFTDAQARKIGLIEAADGGTLLLDEIGELDLALQAKLLRVLENLRVRRLGALQDRQVNVRIIAATNRDLDALVQAGKFRSDLLYRLRVFQINIPPLRARGDDVWLLAQRFVSQLARRYGKPAPQLDASAEAALRQHSWPGNVRELRNLIERSVLLCQGESISSSDLALTATPAAIVSPLPVAAGPAGLAQLDELERAYLVRALTQTGWNVAGAARKLDISRDTLRYRMDKHGLERPPEPESEHGALR
ncbi:sigma-54-dependent transcriptional regulator [Polaromonas jejuensis]|uniref:Sigma-54-dependent transcriptional regulator n=1 Tax=Polaromonas jejuensis TaxID=457502 RepID=A0ABW0Q636_9BURK|nr:sigma-54 dependent transcriptional regulator [Polaromonas jejuensis]